MLFQVTTFVDWDTARRWSTSRRSDDLVVQATRTFEGLKEAVKRTLEQAKPGNNFRVMWRLYHGWHRGKTATAEHRALEALRQSAVRGDGPLRQCATGGKMGDVIFDPHFGFGNELSCGGNRAFLYDTLRPEDRQRPQSDPEQKMVDTALASDLLDHARRHRFQKDRGALVIGDDDDLLPPVFTAVEWGSWVRVLRHRKDDNAHLKTDHIILRLTP